jgi:hypothetical protein
MINTVLIDVVDLVSTAHELGSQRSRHLTEVLACRANGVRAVKAQLIEARAKNEKQFQKPAVAVISEA